MSRAALTNFVSRYSRFSLRALFVVVTLLSVWLGWWFNSAAEQRRGVTALRAVGGSVYYNYESPVQNTFTGTGSSPLPERLVNLLGIDSCHAVACVELAGPSVTDETLKQLAAFPRLQHLYLGNTHVTSAGLRHLLPLAHLKKLVIHSEQLNRAGIAHLAKLPSLEDLEIHFSPYVTDAAIAPLERAQHLKHLWLYETQVTAAGVARLRRALPNCTIECDPPRDPALLTAN